MSPIHHLSSKFFGGEGLLVGRMGCINASKKTFGWKAILKFETELVQRPWLKPFVCSKKNIQMFFFLNPVGNWAAHCGWSCYYFSISPPQKKGLQKLRLALSLPFLFSLKKSRKHLMYVKYILFQICPFYFHPTPSMTTRGYDKEK